jgi:hypothetical protein
MKIDFILDRFGNTFAIWSGVERRSRTGAFVQRRKKDISSSQQVSRPIVPVQSI